MKTIQLITLNEAFSDYEINGGLFSNIGNLPWNSIMVGTQMDILYFDSHSGERYCSGLIAKRVGDDNSLSTKDRETIATLVYARFGQQWNKLWATMNPTYDPYTNYSLSEELTGTDSDIRTPDITKKDTGTLSQAGTDTRTPNITRKSAGTVSDDGSTTGTDQNNVWGFNSASSVPSDASDRSTTANNTNTRDITDTETGTEKNDRSSTDTYDLSHTESGTDTRNGTEHHLLTRKGNIGTNTFQNLIQQERNIWMYDFFEQVFKDVDSVLTLPIY